MIENETVFVLGAGAHCPYKFPTGEQLKEKIVSVVRQSLDLNDGDSKSFSRMAWHGAATKAEVQKERCDEFVHALSLSGQLSIDSFLNANRHQPGFQAIGKGAIAQVLLEHETKSELFSSDDDWMKYLFSNIMLNGADSPDSFIKANKIGFVTFNYDRFLELFLFTRIKHSFGLDDEKALDVLRHIPIHHIYGSLGPFPKTGVDPSDAWILAAKEIRTIHDTEHDIATLNAAKALLSQAHVICLLGFGFHEENTRLLDLVEHVKNCQGVVGCTRYQITNAEWIRVCRPFGSVGQKIQSLNDRCLPVIRNLHLF